MKDYIYEDLISSLKKNEKDFIYAALEIANSGPNSYSPYRFWFNDFKENHNKRCGDVYEFGVYKGDSLISIALLAKNLNSKKHFWGFDTFSGFPKLSEEDDLKNFSERNGFSKDQINDVHLLMKLRLSKKEIENNEVNSSLIKLGKSGLFKDTSFEKLLEKIQLFSLDNITLVKGEFKKTIFKHFSQKKRKIFSANIDCDLYEGYKTCLPLVFNNLEDGGFINLDEYYSLKYPGAKIATDEFLKQNKKARLIKNNTSEYEFDRYYISN